MTVRVLVLGGDFATNCYLLESEKAAVIIDPAEYSPVLEEFLENNAEKHRLILLTHCHFDHISGAAQLRDNTGVDIAIGKNDAVGTKDTRISLSSLFGGCHEPFDADILLGDGERFTVGDIEFKAIETAGHTIGGMCYLSGDMLFCGDTLFYGSVGRTDLYGGNHRTLMKSVSMLAKTLDDSVTVYSGHGPATTIGQEKLYNPYLKNYEAL